MEQIEKCSQRVYTYNTYFYVIIYLYIYICFLGHVAATREQLLLQTQQLAQRRSEKPPKLPPRDNLYPHDIPKVRHYIYNILYTIQFI